MELSGTRAVVAGMLCVLTESGALIGYRHLGRTLGDLVSSSALILLAAVAYLALRPRWPSPTVAPADVCLEFGLGLDAPAEGDS